MLLNRFGNVYTNKPARQSKNRIGLKLQSKNITRKVSTHIKKLSRIQHEPNSKLRICLCVGKG
jgi:hypothetical protein